jgi:hypothetical protein
VESIAIAFFFQDVLNNVVLGIYATRIYVAVLTMAVVILSIYASFTVYSNHITVQQPSLATFEKLHSAYSETLSCPCSQLSVPHKNMTKLITLKYHPVSTFLLLLSYSILSILSVSNSSIPYLVTLTVDMFQLVHEQVPNLRYHLHIDSE